MHAQPPSPESAWPGHGPRGLVGQRLGAYQVERLIAHGGMGAVYEATHAHLGRKVALKLLLAGSEASPEEVARFETEARTLAHLRHPNLVGVTDAAFEQGVFYLAMDLVEGESLHDRIHRGGALPEEEALRILRAAAAGLREAHASGVLHRDLKPANVLVGNDGVARLTDFGVAKVAGSKHMTATGVALGTPAYMAPEQAMGQNRTLDARTDIYGLGAILYECLTGTPPFVGPTPLATMQAVVDRPLVPPRTRRPDLSPAVASLCERCLAKDPAARFASVDALVAAVDRCLAGEPWSEEDRVGAALARTRRLILMTIAVTVVAVGVPLTVLLATVAGGREHVREQAAALRGEAVSDARRTVEGSAPRDRLAALTELTGERVVDGILAKVAPGGDAERAAVARAGAGDPAALARELAPLQARAHLLLAGVELDAVPAAEAIPHLTAAANLDAEGPAGRTARLALARALLVQPGRAARELARVELNALAAAPGDPVGRGALVELARQRAGAGEWSAAHRLVAAAGDGEEAPSAALQALLQLAERSRAKVTLPAFDRVALVRDRVGTLLALARGRDLRLYAFEPGAAGLGAAVRTWQAPSRITRMASADRNGDRRDEVIVAYAAEGAGLQVASVPARGGEATVLVPGGIPGTLAALVVGDVDGDAFDEVVGLLWEQTGASFVIHGGDDANGVVGSRLLSDTRGGYAFGMAAFADLDGDGRDELILGASIYMRDGMSRVMRAGEDGNLEPWGSVRTGRVVGLQRLPDRKGALVVVDYDQDALPTREPDAPPWFGRDGVLVVASDGAGPAVTGRWTFGPDAPPTAASLRATTGVAGWVQRRGETLWVARSAVGPDGLEGRLEFAPIDQLTLAGPAGPALELRTAGAPPRVALVADLDGDGSTERISGRAALGIGAVEAGSEPLVPPAPPESRPRRLLTSARTLLALGHEEEAERSPLATLRGEFPDSWAAEAGRLARADHLLATATQERRRAEQAFVRHDGALGAKALEAAEGAAREAATLAEGRGREAGLSPEQAAAAWARAGHAWSEAGEAGRAAAALERAEQSGGLSPDARDRAAAALHAARREVALRELVVVGPGVASDALEVANPLRTSLGDAARLTCEPDAADSVLGWVDLGGGAPLAVEADLELEGPAWAAVLEVGLFDAAPASATPDRLTGVRIDLWNTDTGRMGLQALVAGRNVGRRFELTGRQASLSVRLRLAPGPGGLRVELEVRAADGALLLVERSLTPAAPPTRALVGAVAPSFRDPVTASAEQGSWPMTSTAVLRRLVVAAAAPRLLDSPGALRRGHAALARGDAAAALALYEPLITSNSRDAPEATFYRGVARAQAGERAAGARDIAAAVKWAPYAMTLALVQAADALVEPTRERVRFAVADALQALRSDEDPRLQAVGLQLLGNLSAHVDPSAEKWQQAWAALTYLSMRRVTVPPAERWRWSRAYLGAFPAGPLPRRAFPRVLPFDREPLDDSTFTGLLAGGDSEEPRQRYVRYARARAARPGAALPQIRLGQLYLEVGLIGAAERLLRGCRSDSDLEPTERQAVLRSLAQIAARRRDRDALAGWVAELEAAGWTVESVLDPETAQTWRTLGGAR